jgi:hypothetical protein
VIDCKAINRDRSLMISQSEQNVDPDVVKEGRTTDKHLTNISHSLPSLFTIQFGSIKVENVFFIVETSVNWSLLFIIKLYRSV